MFGYRTHRSEKEGHHSGNLRETAREEKEVKSVKFYE